MSFATHNTRESTVKQGFKEANSLSHLNDKSKINCSEGFQMPSLPISQLSVKRKLKNTSIDDSIHSPATKKPKLSENPSETDFQIYCTPKWEEFLPSHIKCELQVIKNGCLLPAIQLNSREKGHYIIGRGGESMEDMNIIDIFVLHPSCSRFHAVLQHKSNGDWFLYDFGSTHFTKLNHKKLYAHKYYAVKDGDIIQFAKSSRMYIFKLVDEMNPNSNQVNIQPKQSSKRLQKNSMQDMLHRLQNKIIDNDENETFDGISWGITNENEMGIVSNFNTNDAKSNPETKQLYKYLLHKQKKKEQMQQQLNKLFDKQNSDGCRNNISVDILQKECEKIQRLKTKIEDFEDAIEDISNKINGKLNGRIRKPMNDRRFVWNSHTIDDENDEYYNRITHIKRRKSNQNTKKVQHLNVLSCASKKMNEKMMKAMDYNSCSKELEVIEIKISELNQNVIDIKYQNNRKQKEQKRENIKEQISDVIALQILKEDKQQSVKLHSQLRLLKEKRKELEYICKRLKPAYFQVMKKEPKKTFDGEHEKYKKQKKRLKGKYKHSKAGKKHVEYNSLSSIAASMKEQKRMEEKIVEENILKRNDEMEKSNARLQLKQLSVDGMSKMKDNSRKKGLEDDQRIGLILDVSDDDDKTRIESKSNSIQKRDRFKAEFQALLQKQ